MEKPAKTEDVSVVIDNNQDSTYTVVTVEGYNRPGLLSSLSAAFRDLGLDVGKVCPHLHKRHVCDRWPTNAQVTRMPRLSLTMPLAMQAEVDGEDGRVLDKFYITGVRPHLWVLLHLTMHWLHS